MAHDRVQAHSCLLVIDVQNCFIEGGTLAVTGGKELVPLINKLVAHYRPHFKQIIYTLDYHPHDHVSFASQHVDKSVFDQTLLNYDKTGKICKPSTLKASDRDSDCTTYKQITQVLWTDHCIEDTEDSQLAVGLDVNKDVDLKLLKGTNRDIDSYSAFYDNGHLSQTPLEGLLSLNNVTRVFLVGIATDYCVKYTALDAKYLGYDVYVIVDLTRGVSDDSSSEALEEMKNKGINLIYSDMLDNIFNKEAEI